ncbi:hypothetical protein HME9302_02525 [Alteripontixanthobacter maritimus]|uniref:O-glycosylation ligase, exosortase A system-associated n=1 Tax=Alteripontixanthobacter maritimus TaxID=2161824 RepID=A0A369Q9B8_9SPHN|nr:DUF5935 domain-containing protein [Alteripontixanthobacter maritimus]RDC61304.1 hypothetical protein HME9302_02525 [Alteripontixanthobacter maritimus]
MIDLALFLFIMALLALGTRRPFLWVLTYIYIDILTPQRIGWSITPALPLSLIAFCAAFAGWLAVDSKRDMRVGVRQGLMVLLLAYAFLTTGWADFPEDAAHKWGWVWKALVFAIFLPFTLTTRLRIEAAALVMVLTAGAIIINGGLKTALGGGGYASLYLFVNDNSGIYESSTLSTVAIAIIPLILWFTRHGTVFLPDWRVKLFGYALVFACLLIPVGTEARTGLVCIAVLALVMLRDAKRRLMVLMAGGVLGLAALPFLPQTFYDRMETITGHQQDMSASTRVAVWNWTLDYVEANPWGGGFDAYRGNKFTYELPVEEEAGETTTIVTREEVTDEARAYHSAYFEVLGEQGWFGLTVWLLLHGLGLVQMEVLRRRWRMKAALDTGDGDAAAVTDGWQAPLASALQYGQIVYLVGSLFVGIAYQPFVLLFLALQIGLWNYCKTRESAARETDRRARRARLRTKVAQTAAAPS